MLRSSEETVKRSYRSNKHIVKHISTGKVCPSKSGLMNKHIVKHIVTYRETNKHIVKCISTSIAFQQAYRETCRSVAKTVWLPMHGRTSYSSWLSVRTRTWLTLAPFDRLRLP